jgi:hypothetical protein
MVNCCGEMERFHSSNGKSNEKSKKEAAERKERSNIAFL